MKAIISGRPTLALIGIAALPLVLTACSSSGSGGGAAAGAIATTSAQPTGAASTAADPDSGLPTGSQLKADLVTSGIPSGYALDSSGSVDTGSDYQMPSTSATSAGCTDLDATGWVQLAGYDGVSFAENDYIDKSTVEEFGQEVDAFQGTTAQNVMTALSRIASKCPSFTDSSTSSTVKVSVATGSSLGDGAVVITLADSKWEGSTTLEAVRVGHSVVSVLSSTNSDSAAFAQKMSSEITAKLKAGAN